ncbi:MAG: hypothetical protein JNM08_05185 [Rubrivivax sp.]|nr:hypothetical protein [Rubrivivax sp.]
MNTQQISRVTLETMANYRTAASQVVAASGAGSRRLVKAVDGAVQQQVVLRTAALVPAAGERLDAARDTAARLALQGIEQAVSRSEQAIARSSEFATAQFERWVDAATAIDNRYVVQGLETAARLTLPAAQLALKVSGKVAEGATQLADVAGAHPVKGTVRKAAKGTRRAAEQVQAEAQVKAKAAVRRSRKAVAQVAEAQPVKRARRAARKLAA